MRKTNLVIINKYPRVGSVKLSKTNNNVNGRGPLRKKIANSNAAVNMFKFSIICSKDRRRWGINAVGVPQSGKEIF